MPDIDFPLTSALLVPYPVAPLFLNLLSIPSLPSLSRDPLNQRIFLQKKSSKAQEYSEPVEEWARQAIEAELEALQVRMPLTPSPTLPPSFPRPCCSHMSLYVRPMSDDEADRSLPRTVCRRLQGCVRLPFLSLLAVIFSRDFVTHACIVVPQSWKVNEVTANSRDVVLYLLTLEDEEYR